jgi:hypothetical protein
MTAPAVSCSEFADGEVVDYHGISLVLSETSQVPRLRHLAAVGGFIGSQLFMTAVGLVSVWLCKITRLPTSSQLLSSSGSHLCPSRGTS